MNFIDIIEFPQSVPMVLLQFILFGIANGAYSLCWVDFPLQTVRTKNFYFTAHYSSLTNIARAADERAAAGTVLRLHEIYFSSLFSPKICAFRFHAYEILSITFSRYPRFVISIISNKRAKRQAAGYSYILRLALPFQQQRRIYDHEHGARVMDERASDWVEYAGGG